MTNYQPSTINSRQSTTDNKRSGFIQHSTSKKLSAGFTLVELIVALGLFIAVSFIAVGALLSIVDSNRKANAIRTTMDNLNFALESMTREIRTGDSFDCGLSGGETDCPLSSGGSPQFNFINQDNETITYSTSSDAQHPREDVIYITTSEGKNALTAPDVSISRLRFYVSGTGGGTNQPRVIMVVQGTAGEQARIFTTFNLQSTVSSRLIGG